MHELSIVTELVELACSKAKNEGVSKIHQINVKIGKLSGVVKECLEFVYPEAVKNTMAENSELIVEEVSLQLKCRECHLKSFPKDILIRCTHCFSGNVTIEQGRELSITKMEVE